jgi:hypothetical protein
MLKGTDSRTADKFVIRLPEGMRAKMDLAAWNLYMSMNSFVITAIAEKLDRDQRQELLLDALVAAAKKAAPTTQNPES